MTGLGQDFRYGLRQLRRNPGFAAAAGLTLALGIAATTTVFSFVDAVLLKPLPFPEPDRLYVLWSARGEVRDETVSYPNFMDYRDGTTRFEPLALYRRKRFNVAAGGEAERVAGALVSADFFRTLGIAPVAGRDFAQGEDRRGADQVVVVSDRFWRQRLGGVPEAIGRPVRIEGLPLTVIGVVPAETTFPSGADLWLPISREPRWILESRGLQGYTMVGRLREDATPAEGQEEMAALAAGLAAAHPSHNQGWTIRLQPLQEALTGGVRPTLLLLFGSAGVLLLVSAVNLANMLLAQATARRREVVIRQAVGASNLRLARQLLAENLVLAALGGLLGVVAAVWGVHLWRSAWTDPSGVPSAAAVNWRAMLFALATTTVTALLFGLAPAVRITRAGLGDALRHGSAAVTGSLRGGRVLVACEIALALTLGIGGTLLVRSLLRLQAVDPGFEPAGVLTARISLPETSYDEPRRVISFYRDLLRDIEAIPGVTAAGAAEAVPMTPGGGSYGFAIRGRPTPGPQEWPIASMTAATPGYFRAMGIELVSGRLLEARDDSGVPDVAVINETMARAHWPGASPIGARITFEADQKHWIEVVGVVADVRDSDLGRPAERQVYVAHAQWGPPALSLVARTAGDPLELLKPMQAAVRRLDPEIPLAEARTMEQALGSSLVSHRLRTTILGGFAGLALLLAAVGIYGVMAHLVTQREREIALRMALGARKGDVLAGVIGHSLGLAAPGLVLGLLGALASARLLRTFLYEVRPADPLSLGLALAAVLLLVTAAAAVPARRAARTEPMSVLRGD